ncbi:hypothetical protein ACFYNL_26420 [Streptomyces sp. NPDC007808]|uniref:hypothetical protein n=1 Tax=Streptomyces sp. NPDC007808 TaxID=3364779 RepID=UPI00369A0EB3
MQVEVLAALITAAGAVWVAYVSRGTDRPHIGGPLMSMSRRCGSIRGTATAARKDCEQALERLRRGLPPERTAAERDQWFEDARLGEVLVEEYRFVVEGFDRAVGRYRERVRTVGEKLDELARSTSADRGSRDRELADVRLELERFEASLRSVDGHFHLAAKDYLERQMIQPSRWAAHRLPKRATKRYDLAARRAEEDMLGLLPGQGDGRRPESGGVPPDPEPIPGGEPAAPAEQPPCGYCIWRCPHAPAGTGSLGV